MASSARSTILSTAPTPRYRDEEDECAPCTNGAVHHANPESGLSLRVSVRPELLKQVFINLFDNWVKVEVRSKSNAKGDLVIEMSIGFQSSEAEKIFHFGYRSASAEDKIAQGSGTGLFICDHYARVAGESPPTTI